MREIYRRVRLDVRPNDSHMDRILRESLAPLACKYGLDLCLIDAGITVAEFLDDVGRKDEQYVHQTKGCFRYQLM